MARKQCWIFFFRHLQPLLLVSLIVYGIVIPISVVAVVLSGGTVLPLSPSVIQSCNFVINFIDKNFILPKSTKRLFDHVINKHLGLKYNRLPRGVLNPYLPGYYGETVIGRTYRTTMRVMNPVIWFSRLLFCFIINLIPFVGPYLVILIRAQRSGFKKHRRYFHLKGYTNAQIYFIWVHKKSFYFYFGVTTLLLESIPLLGYLFIFTNTVGAAFWAADLERQLHKELALSLKRNIEDADAVDD